MTNDDAVLLRSIAHHILADVQVAREVYGSEVEAFNKQLEFEDFDVKIDAKLQRRVEVLGKALDLIDEGGEMLQALAMDEVREAEGYR
jgi:glutamine amidotransferase PdxT